MLPETGSGRMMLVGGLLLLASWLVLLLMVIKTIPPSLPLSVLAYAASVGGLGVGLFGIVQYVHHAKRDEAP